MVRTQIRVKDISSILKHTERDFSEKIEMYFDPRQRRKQRQEIKQLLEKNIQTRIKRYSELVYQEKKPDYKGIVEQVLSEDLIF